MVDGWTQVHARLRAQFSSPFSSSSVFDPPHVSSLSSLHLGRDNRNSFNQLLSSCANARSIALQVSKEKVNVL